jgi:hypothetical protein
MSSRPLAIVALLAAITLSQPATAAAGDWFGWLWGRPKPAAQPAPYTPQPIVVAAPPGPYRHPAYANANGLYPWYGYGFGVPTYQWGYCGSTFRPIQICHYGYYNTFTQWGYERGY